VTRNVGATYTEHGPGRLSASPGFSFALGGIMPDRRPLV